MYEITGEMTSPGHCHCRQCQKAHGAAFASYGTVNRRDLHYHRGEEHLTRFQSSDSAYRRFCSVCGSNIEWVDQTKPELVDITLASLDDKACDAVDRHIYTDTKAPWLDLNQHLSEL